MNIKAVNNPIGQLRIFLKRFGERLTQSPEFYNIKHYTKTRSRYRDQKTW